MTSMTRLTLFLAAVAAFVVTPAFAQADGQNVRVSFGAGVTAGAISGEAMIGGSVGYRFSKHFSFDVEVAGSGEPADRFGSRVFDLGETVGMSVGRVGSLMDRGRGGVFSFLPNVATSILPRELSVESSGNTILSTAGFRYFIPATGDRFQPYVSGGLGVARTEESVRLDTGSLQFAPGRPGTAIPIGDIDRSTSHVGLVFGGGVGASIRVFKAIVARHRRALLPAGSRSKPGQLWRRGQLQVLGSITRSRDCGTVSPGQRYNPGVSDSNGSLLTAGRPYARSVFTVRARHCRCCCAGRRIRVDRCHPPARRPAGRRAAHDLPRHAADAPGRLADAESRRQVAAVHAVDAGLERGEAADRPLPGVDCSRASPRPGS